MFLPASDWVRLALATKGTLWSATASLACILELEPRSLAFIERLDE